MICSSGRSTTSMVMSLECSRNEMGSDPRFGSGTVCEAVRPMFCWGSLRSETKRVFSWVSLGNPRASPPRIRLQTGGTRSISMGYAVQHFEWRQFFGEPVTICPVANHPPSRAHLSTYHPHTDETAKVSGTFFHRCDFFSERRIIGTREVNHLLH